MSDDEAQLQSSWTHRLIKWHFDGSLSRKVITSVVALPVLVSLLWFRVPLLHYGTLVAVTAVSFGKLTGYIELPWSKLLLFCTMLYWLPVVMTPLLAPLLTLRQALDRKVDRE